tara:strand:+ start:207 stop:1088 length:882 start_codon:yes stop_codon:yes gene_type:complete
MDYRLIRHLASFKIVAEERHFGHAAKRLGISQPPLSQQIMTLEHHLGVKLFERSRSGVSLTPEGKHILPAVEIFLGEGEMLEAAVLEASQGRTNRIIIGAIVFTMTDLLPGLFEKARKQMPDVSFYVREFDSNEALDALEREEIDVAFLRAEDNIANLRIVPLTTERLVLALPNSHKLAGNTSVELSTLAAEPMVYCPRAISPSYFDRIMTICRNHGLQPRLTFEARSITSQLAFVACGIAIGLVPVSMQTSSLSDVTFVPVQGDTDIVTAAVACNTQNQNATVNAFIELVTA